MSSCIFCDIVAGKAKRSLVWEDENVMVINDIHPAASTHILVIPKKHAVDLTDMTDKEVTRLLLAVKKVIKDLGISKYRIVHNGGGAQLINHAHVHIMGAIDPHRKL